MKKCCLYVDEYFCNNRIFNIKLHRDNLTDRFVKLKKEFFNLGYDLSTQDINTIEKSDIIIYSSNMPLVLPNERDKDKSYLILTESEFIRPDNYDLNKHKYFRKIFTWDDRLVDNKKYYKLNYAHAFPENINKDLSKKKKLCVLIAGNKKASSKLNPELLNLDLYKERENAIRWFEKEHLEDFDLYGTGWNKYKFSGPKYIRLFNRIPFFPELYQNIVAKKYLSYKGEVANKRDIMERYKFSICYENARDIPGYITEKIFDCFFAGCVPIYRGANNIEEFIPSNCFIDKRSFPTYEDLFIYIYNMSDEVYMDYIDNIDRFLRSKKSISYSSEGFVSTIITNILKNF